MNTKINNVVGTRDLFGENLKRIRFVEKVARELSERYLFSEIDTPIIEYTELFVRNLGEVSDVVGKELYSFEDKSGHQICLRPEFTAAVVRAFVGNFQHLPSPVKLFSFGPLFRYERPQKGRYRQFHQVNFEWIGITSFLWDVEAIVLAVSLLKELGIENRLHINSLGCSKTREDYRLALVDYFKQHRNHLSPDSMLRLERNPLRILDSKDPADREIVEGAPKILEYHTEASLVHFESICNVLRDIEVDFSINHKLVRGLDYYSGLIFECTSASIGAQDALLGGGRYEQLSENLGGKKVSSVGFASGIERLIEAMTVEVSAQEKIISVVPIGEVAQKKAVQLVPALRTEGFCVDIYYDLKLRSRMERSKDSFVTLIFGDDELSRNECVVKLMETGTEHQVSLDALSMKLKELDC